MTYTVSITSQGQISIPAKLRKELGLHTKEKALVKLEGKKLVIEPIPDILSLAGSLKHKAIKGKSLKEIMAIEEKAIEEGFVERYKRYLKSQKK